MKKTLAVSSQSLCNHKLPLILSCIALIVALGVGGLNVYETFLVKPEPVAPTNNWDPNTSRECLSVRNMYPCACAFLGPEGADGKACLAKLDEMERTCEDQHWSAYVYDKKFRNYYVSTFGSKYLNILECAN